MRRLVVLLACCCSSAPPTKSGGNLTQPPQPQSRRGLAGYPTVVEPSNIDCTYDGPWGQGQPRELRLGEGGPVFATAFQTTNAHLELGGSAAFLEIDVEGFRLWGHVDRAVLHPARAFVMAGYLVPGPHSSLRPVTTLPQRVTVEITPPKFVKPLSPPRDTRPCKDVGLAYIDLAPASALDRALAADGYKVPANTPIPIAASHGAPAVAELRFDEEAHVRVVEQRGELARIFIDDSADRDTGVSVVGWVSRSLLAPDGGSGREGGWSVGNGRPVSSGLSRAKRHVKCTHEVPLIVELGAARHLAGAILPDTKFGVIDGPEETIAITLDRISLQLAVDARLLVKRSAINDCVDVPR